VQLGATERGTRNAERNGPKSGEEKTVNYGRCFPQVPDPQWVGILTLFKITENHGKLRFRIAKGEPRIDLAWWSRNQRGEQPRMNTDKHGF